MPLLNANYITTPQQPELGGDPGRSASFASALAISRAVPIWLCSGEPASHQTMTVRQGNVYRYWHFTFCCEFMHKKLFHYRC
jgi:hypothetical protein